MPPAEALSRSQLAQQAQPPPPHSQASEHKDQPSASASPRDHMESGLAALQQGSYSAMSNDTPSEDADARNKSKRELSTSKRAAQNRAAQVSSFLYFTVDYCVVYVLTFESEHSVRGRSVTSRSSRRKLSNSRRWKPTFEACRMRTISCGNTSLACNPSFSSRPESLHPRRPRHLAGGEMLNKHRITCYPTALPHPRSLPVSPLRVRLQRVGRGASTSITCANGIVNIPPIEVLLVARRLTHRRRSESQRIKLVFALYFLRVVIGRHCLATTRVVYVGGSLFGCCCWSGAAVGLYWLMIYLTCTGEDVLLLHYSWSNGPRESFIDPLPNLVYQSALLCCLSVFHVACTSYVDAGEHSSLF